MSLTEEAAREREWGRFPALRQLLEGERLPDRYFGYSSVSDKIFDGMARLMKHSILVLEYEENIRKATSANNRQQLRAELLDLEAALESASLQFDQTRERLVLIRKSL